MVSVYSGSMGPSCGVCGVDYDDYLQMRCLVIPELLLWSEPPVWCGGVSPVDPGLAFFGLALGQVMG